MDRDYGAEPKICFDPIEVNCQELMFYQYLPIKLTGTHECTMEGRLDPFCALIGAAACDFIADFGLTRYVESYVYLTVKHMYTDQHQSLNRPGWHSDGFMTDDINYIWSNKTPTVWIEGVFPELSKDDVDACEEINILANRLIWESNCERALPEETLVRLDQFVIHALQSPKEPEYRMFVKISFSKDRYDLIGNSHNFMLDYAWPMRPRASTRNVPQELK